MHSLSEVPFAEFQNALTREKVRPFQVIYLGLAFGIVVFGFVVLYLWLVQGPDHPPSESDYELTAILSAVHGFLAISLGLSSSRLFRRQFSRERLEMFASLPLRSPEGEEVTDPIEKCLSLIRMAVILRLALFEAIALFGLIVCTIAILNGILQVHTEFALNLVTPLGFLIYVSATFPTGERIAEMFRTNITSMT